MTEIERIKRYIQNTKVAGRNAKYGMKPTEWMAIDSTYSSLDAISLAFEYGYAKACRAAKAEQRKAVKG